MTDRHLLRRREGHDAGRVSYVELFFDLVFVFAVTQLSHSLLHHFDPAGALHTLLLLLAVWWVWIYTSWVTNWLDPERIPVRFALLVLMLLGLVLSSSIPEAFESRGLAFAGAYVAMQVGRSAFFLWAVRGHPTMVRNFQRIFAWLATSGVFWIAGGLADHHARLALWAIALGIEYLGPISGFWIPILGRSTTNDWDVAGGHLAERCALFIIIALGESVLVTGATFAEMEWSALTVASFGVSFVGSLAMWWIYFDTAAEFGSHTIGHSRDPGRLARLTYTYIHLLPVAGIIVSAVADEQVLVHPVGHTSPGTAAVILGGNALYLAGTALFRYSLIARVPRGPLTGLAALGALALLAGGLSPLGLASAATVVLLGVAVGDAAVHRGRGTR